MTEPNGENGAAIGGSIVGGIVIMLLGLGLVYYAWTHPTHWAAKVALVLLVINLAANLWSSGFLPLRTLVNVG